MPNIGDKYQDDIDVSSDANKIRSQIGAHFGALYARTLMKYDPNKEGPIGTDVIDYIIQRATIWVIRERQVYKSKSARTTAVDRAKNWVQGYITWYLAQEHMDYRDDVLRQPTFTVIVKNGAEEEAKALYSNIPWEAAYFDETAIWFSEEIPDAALRRLNNNLMGFKIISSEKMTLRNQSSYLLPATLQKSKDGPIFRLGGEILSDWLIPGDNAHGHPLSTIHDMFQNRKVSAISTKTKTVETGRNVYEIIKAGKWRLIVDETNDPPLIISCFKLQ